jgi:hypothetical protein
MARRQSHEQFTPVVEEWFAGERTSLPRGIVEHGD